MVRNVGKTASASTLLEMTNISSSAFHCIPSPRSMCIPLVPMIFGWNASASPIRLRTADELDSKFRMMNGPACFHLPLSTRLFFAAEALQIVIGIAATLDCLCRSRIVLCLRSSVQILYELCRADYSQFFRNLNEILIFAGVTDLQVFIKSVDMKTNDWMDASSELPSTLRRRQQH